MKKTLFNVFFWVIALSMMAFSCDSDDNIISAKSLPASAKSFINLHFYNTAIIKAEVESYGKYSVDLSNGVDIEFDLNGNWIKVDAPNGVAIPTGFIPANIVSYVTTNYPNKAFNSIEKKINFYEVELIGVNKDLIFNINGNFVGLDN